MENLLHNLKTLLQKDERLISEGELLKNKIIELVLKLDKELIKLLLSDKKMKQIFFTDIDKTLIFDKDKFIRFVSNKQFLPDSYTAFKNKIGLTAEDEYLSEKKEVVLSWPYKDCVLEGGMTKEDQKRDEIFWNEILAPDEISRLLDHKVFTNAKRIDKKGEHKLDKFKTDENGNIKDNLIIKGNNLLALHSLKKRFAGKVKLIYIDPPYNKKGDTFYNDAFKRSSWLTFMKNRLDIAKQLLSDEGIIFAQIDATQLGYLQVLLDDVFDEKRQAIISIKVKSPSGDSSKVEKLVEDVSEYILVYSKQDSFKSLNPLTIKEIVDEESKTASQYNSILISKGRITTKAFDFYVGSEKNKTKIEVFNVEGFEIKRVPRRELSKDFFVKNYEKVCRTAKFSGKFLEQFRNRKGTYFFKYTPSRGKNAGIETETYVFNGEGLIYLKDFSEIIELDDGSKAVAKIETATSFITDIPWQGIAKEGGVTLTKGKKPEELLKRIIEWTTREGEIVMDYHLGTGTTCAVAHKMGRQYIGIEQLDYGENSAVVRLKNVINSDQSGVSKSIGWKGGGDFVYLELMKWNENFVEKIRKAKTKEELENLWETMKKKAFLSYKVDIKTVDENAKDFANLSIEDQKRFLLECLYKNHLYVNYSEVDDEEYGVSDEEKKLNKEFYANK
ncbi:MAG: site-specific DNA-methyltransferase [Patescibacteria group bacterium]